MENNIKISSKIESKIENLIKKRIKQLGLINTGKMYNSIEVVSYNGGFKVKAVDYFQYLNEEYNITDYVFSSQEFIDLIIDSSISQIKDNISDNLSDLE